jgi:hypothetical protein
MALALATKPFCPNAPVECNEGQPWPQRIRLERRSCESYPPPRGCYEASSHSGAFAGASAFAGKFRTRQLDTDASCFDHERAGHLLSVIQYS